MNDEVTCPDCTDEAACEECCDHGDMDDAHCMDCGKDRTEDLMCAAYDRWKNRD